MTSKLHVGRGAFACSVLALGFSQSAWAADNADSGFDDGNTITVTATQDPVEVEDAPAAVTVIDQEQIPEELAADVRDIVRF